MMPARETFQNLPGLDACGKGTDSEAGTVAGDAFLRLSTSNLRQCHNKPAAVHDKMMS